MVIAKRLTRAIGILLSNLEIFSEEKFCCVYTYQDIFGLNEIFQLRFFAMLEDNGLEYLDQVFKMLKLIVVYSPFCPLKLL